MSENGRYESDNDIDSDIEDLLYSQLHYSAEVDFNENSELIVKEEDSFKDTSVESLVRSDNSEADKGKKDEWAIIEKDLQGAEKYNKLLSNVQRYYVEKKEVGAKCFNCSGRGHLSRDCPNPTKKSHCYLCGESGHLRRDCPNDVCYNCHEVGHISRYCTEGKRQNYAVCKRCWGRGHNRSTCPEIWRQFHLTVKDEGKLVKPKMNKGGFLENLKDTRYCYFCGLKGHFGHDCKENAKWNRRSINTPFVVYYDKCPYTPKQASKRIETSTKMSDTDYQSPSKKLRLDEDEKYMDAKARKSAGKSDNERVGRHISDDCDKKELGYLDNRDRDHSRFDKHETIKLQRSRSSKEISLASDDSDSSRRRRFFDDNTVDDNGRIDRYIERGERKEKDHRRFDKYESDKSERNDSSRGISLPSDDSDSSRRRRYLDDNTVHVNGRIDRYIERGERKEKYHRGFDKHERDKSESSRRRFFDDTTVNGDERRERNTEKLERKSSTKRDVISMNAKKETDENRSSNRAKKKFDGASSSSRVIVVSDSYDSDLPDNSQRYKTKSVDKSNIRRDSELAPRRIDKESISSKGEERNHPVQFIDDRKNTGRNLIKVSDVKETYRRSAGIKSTDDMQSDGNIIDVSDAADSFSDQNQNSLRNRHLDGHQSGLSVICDTLESSSETSTKRRRIDPKSSRERSSNRVGDVITISDTGESSNEQTSAKSSCLAGDNKDIVTVVLSSDDPCISPKPNDKQRESNGRNSRVVIKRTRPGDRRTCQEDKSTRLEDGRTRLEDGRTDAETSANPIVSRKRKWREKHGSKDMESSAIKKIQTSVASDGAPKSTRKSSVTENLPEFIELDVYDSRKDEAVSEVSGNANQNPKVVSLGHDRMGGSKSQRKVKPTHFDDDSESDENFQFSTLFVNQDDEDSEEEDLRSTINGIKANKNKKSNDEYIASIVARGMTNDGFEATCDGREIDKYDKSHEASMRSSKGGSKDEIDFTKYDPNSINEEDLSYYGLSASSTNSNSRRDERFQEPEHIMFVEDEDEVDDDYGDVSKPNLSFATNRLVSKTKIKRLQNTSTPKALPPHKGLASHPRKPKLFIESQPDNVSTNNRLSNAESSPADNTGFDQMVPELMSDPEKFGITRIPGRMRVKAKMFLRKKTSNWRNHLKRYLRKWVTANKLTKYFPNSLWEGGTQDLNGHGKERSNQGSSMSNRDEGQKEKPSQSGNVPSKNASSMVDSSSGDDVGFHKMISELVAEPGKFGVTTLPTRMQAKANKYLRRNIDPQVTRKAREDLQLYLVKWARTNKLTEYFPNLPHDLSVNNSGKRRQGRRNQESQITDRDESHQELSISDRTVGQGDQQSSYMDELIRRNPTKHAGVETNQKRNSARKRKEKDGNIVEGQTNQDLSLSESPSINDRSVKQGSYMDELMRRNPTKHADGETSRKKNSGRKKKAKVGNVVEGKNNHDLSLGESPSINDRSAKQGSYMDELMRRNPTKHADKISKKKQNNGGKQKVKLQARNMKKKSGKMKNVGQRQNNGQDRGFVVTRQARNFLNDDFLPL